MSAEPSRPSHIYLVCHPPTHTHIRAHTHRHAHHDGTWNGVSSGLSSVHEILIVFVRAVCSTLFTFLRGVCSIGRVCVCQAEMIHSDTILDFSAAPGLTRADAVLNLTNYQSYSCDLLSAGRCTSLILKSILFF